MDCQDGNLAFACHSHVFPSGHCPHNLWLVLCFFSLNRIHIHSAIYIFDFCYLTWCDKMLWSYLALLVWFTCVPRKSKWLAFCNKWILISNSAKIPWKEYFLH
jgi:hypothetical protein